LIGAAVAVVAKSISNIINGVPFWYGMGMTVASSIVTGSISFGIGAIANGTLPAVTDRLLHSAAGMLLDQFLPKININLGKNFTLSFNMSVMLGHSYGFGLNASLVYDDGNFSFAAGYGITKFTNYNGLGINGWEHRFSGLFGYGGKDFKMSLGTNDFRGMKGLKGESLNQRIGLLGFSSGDFGFMYENDGGDGIKQLGLGDKEDRYRSAALSISIGDFSTGFNLFTGNRVQDNEKAKEIIGHNKRGKPKYGYPPLEPELRDSYGRRHKYGFVNEEGPRYRLGALYLSYQGYRIGVNSEHVRHAIQNRLVHNKINDLSFENQSWQWDSYFQYRTPNTFTSW
jgi:hypothetical protein